jgi:hypothetical protein
MGEILESKSSTLNLWTSKFDDRGCGSLSVSNLSSHDNLTAWVNLSDCTVRVLSPLYQVHRSTLGLPFIHCVPRRKSNLFQGFEILKVCLQPISKLSLCLNHLHLPSMFINCNLICLFVGTYPPSLPRYPYIVATLFCGIGRWLGAYHSRWWLYTSHSRTPSIS